MSKITAALGWVALRNDEFNRHGNHAGQRICETIQQALTATQWQPIETYDRDKHGEDIMVCDASHNNDDDVIGSMAVAWIQESDWDDEDRIWITGVCDHDGYSYYNQEPTHWMPLPKPPKEQK